MSEANAEIIDLVAHIVSAYVSNNRVPAADLPALIATTHSAMTGLGKEQAAPTPAEKPAPAVSIKKSITSDFLICLEDGKKFKSLKRHLRTAYDLTPDEYRTKWGLPRTIRWSLLPMPKHDRIWRSRWGSGSSVGRVPAERRSSTGGACARRGWGSWHLRERSRSLPRSGNDGQAVGEGSGGCTMKSASTQIDLFDDAPGYREAPRAAPRKRGGNVPPLPAGWNEEEAAQRLEQGGRYRVLRKLVPRAVIPRAESRFPNLAVLIDTETTGLSHAKDEIIEIGAVAFTYDGEERSATSWESIVACVSPRTRSQRRLRD